MMIFEEKIKVLDDIFIHTVHENYKSVPDKVEGRRSKHTLIKIAALHMV
jgi:hypothetical protein